MPQFFTTKLRALLLAGLASPVSERSHESFFEGLRSRACQQTTHFPQPDLVEELAQRGLSLSPEDRARLAERLLDSLQEPTLAKIEAAWDEEIERRAAAYERGEVETFAAEDVFAEARRIAP